jgi:hypothetical protein
MKPPQTPSAHTVVNELKESRVRMANVLRISTNNRKQVVDLSDRIEEVIRETPVHRFWGLASRLCWSNWMVRANRTSHVTVVSS